MTHDYRLNWTLPALPLGPSIKPEQEKPRDEIAEFNSGDHKINGAASRAATPSTSDAPAVEPNATTPEAAPPSAAPVFKPGDRVRCLFDNGREEVGIIERASVAFDGEWKVKYAEDGGEGIFRPDQLELLSPSTTDDGWIEWMGGECPVEKDARVQIRLRDGSEYLGSAAAYSVIWGHNLDYLDDFLEVVAYRILKDHQ